MESAHIPQNSEWSYKCYDMEVAADELQYQSNQWHDGHNEVEAVPHKTIHNNSIITYCH